MTKLVAQKADLVHVVFRHFPLQFHPNAFDAAVFAQCAHEQHQFQAYHDRLFAGEVSLERKSLWAIAEALKLDRDKMQSCVSATKTETIIKTDLNEGRQIGVQGTPSIFINGEAYQGDRDLESLIKAVEKYGQADPLKDND